MIKNDQQFVIRKATAKDVQNLAELHVKAWNQTYQNTAPDPSVATRMWQWAEIFKKQDDSWFCYVIENADHELIGFSKGQTYQHSDLPAFDGEINKIYILKEYHRLGLGKRLLKVMFDRFLGMGINAVLLFGDAANPSGGFHEAMGAQKIYAANGKFNGGYAWYDIGAVNFKL